MDKKLKILGPVLFVFISLLAINLKAQKSSFNGNSHPVKGTIRCFVIFAEVINDPYDAGTCWDGPWLAGKMPANADSYFDPHFTGAENISTYITKYFYEASMGNLIVLGDYYPRLVQIAYDTAKSGANDAINDALGVLAKLPINDISTKNYLRLSTHFDNWKLDDTNALGYPKLNQADGYLDLIVVIFRSHSKYRIRRDGGHASVSNLNHTIKNKLGGHWALICADDIKGNIRHEITHKFLGGNEFHSGGAGAGRGTFLSNMGGFSMLSSYNTNLNFINAWDRYRLNWKPSNMSYRIWGLNAGNYVVNTDLIYQGGSGALRTYILRDFASTGDALRIKLPYLREINSQAKEQWLWIENRQLKAGSVEADANLPKGIRINLQVGNEDITSFSSTTNYISPFSSFGNWDFSYALSLHPDTLQSASKPTDYALFTSSDQANPLTGYSLLECPAYNFTEPNRPNGTSYFEIWNDEMLPAPLYIKKDNNLIRRPGPYPHPIFGGTPYDIFPVGSVLNLSNNPAPLPKLTHRTKSRGFENSTCDIHAEDNRYIYLNGLRIEVAQQYADGSIRVVIRYNDYDIAQNLRWCGPIVLKEKMIIKPSISLSLDQGYTPTKSGNPQIIQGEAVFADPTFLRARSGSTVELQENAQIRLKRNSQLIMETGSILKSVPNSLIIAEQGSNVLIHPGIHRSEAFGKIIIENKGYTTSDIFVQNVNTNAAFSRLYSYSGGNIYMGSHVTPSKNIGAVNINSGTKMSCFASGSVVLDKGFEVKKGGYLETGKHTSISSSFNNPILLGDLQTDPLITYALEINTAGMGNTYTGANNQVSSDVFYKFTLPIGATLRISTCGSPLSDTYIHLLSRTGAHLISNDDNGACFFSEHSQIYQSFAAGTYYLVVEGYGNAEGIIKTNIEFK